MITLSKPIKPGFRRKLIITPDEPIDGSLRGSVLDGDSSAPTINPDGKTVFVNGDGSDGAKQVRISADGHVGDGDREVNVDIQYEVRHPDATVLDAVEADPSGDSDEPIPAA